MLCFKGSGNKYNFRLRATGKHADIISYAIAICLACLALTALVRIVSL